MKEIDSVLTNYLTVSTVGVPGHLQRRKVVGGAPLDVDRVIEADLPAVFERLITEQGRTAADYKIYGSVGQPNRYVAKIPWVAILHGTIARSTTHGYYVVLLFREDMTGCVLSLNQGFTHFQKAFGTDELAHRKVQEAAEIAVTYLTIPPGFVVGKIDLGATGDMGAGYEEGAIVSKVYNNPAELSEALLKQDCATLLQLYDTLRAKLGTDLISAVPSASDADFQQAAATLSTAPDDDKPILPAGPLTPPKKTGGSGLRSGFRRDPKIASLAMRNAEHSCEIDGAHTSFVSRRTGKQFVEAHHLLPMQYQDQFKASLDVPENIIVLCPTCHRRLHHGIHSDNRTMIKSLYEKRALLLKERGLEIDDKTLVKFYTREIIDV